MAVWFTCFFYGFFYINNMKYFLHDTNSFQDEKVTELFIQFGYEGVGLFYTILEKLALQEKPVKTDVLKKQLFIGKRLQKCWSFLEQIELISSNNGETFNKQLLNFSKKYQVKKEKNAKRIAQWRKNQVDKEDVTRYEHVRNTDKVNRSKVNRSKKKTLPTNEFVIEREILNNVYDLFDFEIISNLTITQKNDWLDIINKLNRLDNYTYTEIEDTIVWGRNDDFWRSNFHSILGLRKKRKETGLTKFFQINKKMNYERTNGQKQSNKQAEDIRKIVENIANDPDLF